MKTRFLFAAALASSLSLVGAARADEVDDLFLAGQKAMEEGNLNVAYDRLLGAWTKRKSADIAANLSQVEAKLGKKADAANHLDYAIRNYPVTGDPALKQQMQAFLDTIKPDVGVVEIRTAPKTNIEIDGVVVGVTPLGEHVFVEPGSHVVVGKNADLGEGNEKVMCTRGEALEITITLKATGGTPPPTGPRPVWPLIVGGVVFGGGVAAGIGLSVAAAGKRSDAESSADDCRDHGFGIATQNGPHDTCQWGPDNVSSARTLQIGSYIGFGIGALGAIGGTVLYFAMPRSASKNIALVPIAGPGIGGLSTTLRF